jgi:DNA mismatch endonuclease (patch repair protein)
MTDTRTREQRRQIMRAVRSKDTSAELALRQALYAAGIRGWRCHYRRAAGTPDLAWPVLRVAVFVDGAFWHGHPSRHRPGRSGKYWYEKIAATVQRDRQTDRMLEAQGWTVLRFWDFEIGRNPSDVVASVATTLSDRLGAASIQTRWRRELQKRNVDQQLSIATCNGPTFDVGAPSRDRGRLVSPEEGMPLGVLPARDR